MSAFGGKADMTFCENPLSRSLLGVKRTSLFAPHMSAYGPKRTSRFADQSLPFCCRLSRALPVGHAFSDKFSSISFCNVLLPCLCDALLSILPTQPRSAQGWRSGCCCLSHDVSSEQNQRENNQ